MFAPSEGGGSGEGARSALFPGGEAALASLRAARSQSSEIAAGLSRNVVQVILKTEGQLRKSEEAGVPVHLLATRRKRLLSSRLWSQARGVDPNDPDSEIRVALGAHWSTIRSLASLRPFGTGLINRTYLVEDGPARFVLQQVSRIFPAGIHRNIEAVTEHLHRRGMLTPRLIRTSSGALFVDLGAGGVWRLMTHIEGISFDVIASPEQARAAGQLVGRFHREVEGVEHDFAERRRGAHDTPAHLARLREALAGRVGHRLFSQVAALAERMLDRAESLPALPALPERVGHGDLKFNNVLFEPGPPGGKTGACERALCLIDLDTVGPAQLAFELGDAWRSWCNRNGENQPEAAFDLQILAASLDGYRAGLGRPLREEERLALLLGLEWVSLELAVRFAADALHESYFGWDSELFAGRGEHNLVRAQGQWSLHEAVVAARPERAQLLEQT
jgi:Ser/Thr protein kinase RdoA (MazF antagonist)